MVYPDSVRMLRAGIAHSFSNATLVWGNDWVDSNVLTSITRDLFFASHFNHITVHDAALKSVRRALLTSSNVVHF
jgi:hypothetical protein